MIPGFREGSAKGRLLQKLFYQFADGEIDKEDYREYARGLMPVSQPELYGFTWGCIRGSRLGHAVELWNGKYNRAEKEVKDVSRDIWTEIKDIPVSRLEGSLGRYYPVLRKKLASAMSTVI